MQSNRYTASKRARFGNWFRPRLELLEGRWCPAVNAFKVGHTLFVLGDELDNAISVRDYGERGVHVTGDGRDLGIFTGVRLVSIAALAGNDFIDAGPANLQADLGDGDDVFVYDATRWTVPTGTQLDVVGGHGGDQFRLMVGNPNERLALEGSLMASFLGGPGSDSGVIAIINVGVPGDLIVNVDTGDGDDTSAVTISDSEIGGTLAVEADLGAGNDVFEATFQAPPDPEAPGGIAPPDPDRHDLFDISAGAGEDRVSVSWSAPPDPEFVFRADLGDGNDVLEATFVAPPEPDRPGQAEPPEPDMPVLFDIVTGAGNDRVTAAWSAPPEPDFVFRTDLGSGHDQFEALFQAPPEPEQPPPNPDFGVLFDILAGAGDDGVSFTFFDILSDVHARVDLGAGDDSFAGKIEIVDLNRGGPGIAQLDPGNFVGFDVLGQGGNDRFQLDIGSRTTPEPHLLNSDVDAQFDGGMGNDRFDIFLGGPDTGPEPHLVNGTVSVNVDGGDGSENSVIAIVNAAVNGAFAGNANWGAGIDFTEWVFDGVDVNGSIDLNDHGGDGMDNIKLTYQWQIARGGSAEVHAFGGLGRDEIMGLNQNHIAEGGAFATTFDGGDGNDRVGFTYSDAQVDGRAFVHLMGSAGDDTLTMHLNELTVGGTLHTYMDGGGGSDHLSVMLAEDHIPGLLEANLDGGFGNDIMNVEVLDCRGGGDVQVVEDAGAGDDRVALSSSNSSFESLGVAVDAGSGADEVGIIIDWIPPPDLPSSVDVSVAGGAGADQIGIIVDYVPGSTSTRLGPVDASVLVDAGAGNDTVLANIDLAGFADGHVTVDVLGGDGNDLLGLIAVGIVGPEYFQGLVDGGEGFDVAFVSSGVRVRNAERLFNAA